MARIQIFVDETSPYLQLLDQPATLMDRITEFLGTAAEDVADKIRANASGSLLQAHSGKLAASVHVTGVDASAKRIRIGISGGGGDAYYGLMQERGAKGFEEQARDSGILTAKGRKRRHRKGAPRGAKALHFMANGQEVFAKAVEKPALPASHWFTSVLQEMTPEIVAGVNQIIEDWSSQK